MEIYTIPLVDPCDSGKWIIYRPLAKLAFIGNRAMADIAVRLAAGHPVSDREPLVPEDVTSFLNQIGFLDPDPEPPPGQPTTFNSLVLLLTNQCHLRCKYCYAAAGEHPHEELSEEHARAAVDFYFDQAAARGLSQAVISFFGGGEPTYAWKLMQHITRYIRSKPLPALIDITTNAMWSPQQGKWICENIDSMGVSMDGMPETQDRQRPLVSGKNSSPIVMRNLAALDERDMNYGIRMTVTPPWDHLPLDIEYICQKTSCQSIHVEPAFNTDRGKHQIPEEAQWQQFAAAFIEAYEVAHRYQKELYYSGARPGTPTGTFCTSPYDALVIAPGGKIVSCYEITSEDHPLAAVSNYGEIEDGQVRVDEQARLRLQQLLAQRRATCRDCFCYWTCAGDCYVQTFAPGTEGHLAKSYRCQMNRKITQEMLLTLIAEGDGYWDGRGSSVSMPTAQSAALEEGVL